MITFALCDSEMGISGLSASPVEVPILRARFVFHVAGREPVFIFREMNENSFIAGSQRFIFISFIIFRMIFNLN